MNAAPQFAVKPAGRIINTSSDFTGLRIAARELFEEELFADDDERMLKRAEVAANAQAILAGLTPRRTLSPGYYDRALYLLDLDALFELGIRFDLSQLEKDELRGLKAVRLAKTDFENAHPRCRSCGRMQKKFGVKCEKCGTEMNARRAS